ncbi:hypothetical protein JTB14_019588 [Gonioctena quinquepunctata]|nr:hypothetical protein JTB14_019588 [Gonioctena quinquepunctata]
MSVQRYPVLVFVYIFCYFSNVNSQVGGNIGVSVGGGLSSSGRVGVSVGGGLSLSGGVSYDRLLQLSRVVDNCLAFDCLRTQTITTIGKALGIIGGPVTGKKKYSLGTEEVTYCQALDKCRQKSRQLIRINDESENNAITKLLEKHGAESSFWSSGNKCFGINWSSPDGTKLPFSNWSPNKPDGSGYCIAVAMSNGTLGWEDKPCGDKLQYICDGPSNGEECEESETPTISKHDSCLQCDALPICKK